MPVSASAISLNHFTTFGDFLKYLRRRAGLTQRDLSIQVGYSDTQISRLELNQRLPDLATIAALFVPALRLDHESELTTRLLELGAEVRREDAPAPGLPPFKGLHYFDEADAHLFFGREALIAKLVSRIFDEEAEHRTGKRDVTPPHFLAIVGASGSGKSSIVRAGLIPALRWNRASADWPIHVLTPTAHPLEALAASLTRETSSPATTATVMDDLARDARSLYLCARRQLGQQTPERRGDIALLVVVDQMEELFTLCREAAERQAFVDNLLTASVAGGPVFVIVTLRADFYSHCAPYAGLREALAQHQEFIGPMSATELRQAMEAPAKRGGWDFEPGLVDLILKEVGVGDRHQPEPGALPLLSHALLEAWRRRQGHRLTLSGYLSSGGVHGAIAETAEAVFHDQLDPNQRAIARRIFLRLTELGDDSSVADTRRRASFAELITSPNEVPAVRAVLQQLADARLIVTEADAAEVAHEALIREWPTLRAWLDENREALRLHRHLTEAAHTWAEAGRQPGDLYREARLAQALGWQTLHAAELNLLEREFLQTSQHYDEQAAKERETQRQRELADAKRLVESAHQLAEAERARAEGQSRSNQQLRRRAVYLTGAFMLAFIMAGIALALGAQARQSAQVANANFARAEAQRLAVEALNLMISGGGDVQRAALLSLRSMQIQYTPAGDAALTKVAGLPLPRQIFSGHTDPLLSAVFSPDGQLVLTSSDDGTLRLWDTQTGQMVRQWEDGEAGFTDAVFSPDGRSVLVGSWRASPRLWAVETGELLQTLTPHLTARSVAFSPDDRLAATGSWDKTVKLWDLQTGQALHTLYGPGSANSVAFSPDGRYLIARGGDKTAMLWDIASGERIYTFSGHTDSVASVAVSPDSQFVLTASDTTAYLWDLQNYQILQTFSGHTSLISYVAFSPDGQFVLTGSLDKTARLWEAETGRVVQVYAGHSDGVNSVAFSLDGRHVLTASRDKTAWVWDVGDSGEFPTFTGHSIWVNRVAFSPDGQTLLTGSSDNTARLWDVQTGGQLHVLAHDSVVVGVAFSPDGQSALAASFDNNAWLWDAQTGREIGRYFGHTGYVNNVAFSPDGQYALTGSWDNTARLWEAQTGKRLQIFSGHTDVVYGVAFAPDGQTALTGSWDGTARLWDVQTGQEIQQFIGHAGRVNGVAFAPDGLTVATTSDDNTARLWDVQTGKELRRFVGHTDILRSVAFSPDGGYLLTASFDQTARLWDVQTGQELRRLSGHAGLVNQAVFSPDGQLIATASDDLTARLWDVDYANTVRYLCSRLLRDFTGEERAQYNIPNDGPTCPSP